MQLHGGTDVLPTDKEYLDEFCTRFKDDEWIAMQEQFVKEPRCQFAHISAVNPRRRNQSLQLHLPDVYRRASRKICASKLDGLSRLIRSMDGKLR